MSPPRVVAVYGGGGAKAAAHLGAERALRERGLAPAAYVGCSMGAVVAAGFALGMDPEALEARMVELGRRPVAVPDPLVLLLGVRRPALLKGAPLRAAFEALIPVRRFADLKHPLTVTATDLDRGDQIILGAGGEDVPLIDALMASCALPVYFPPVRLGTRRAVDGGLRAVVPVEVALRHRPERVVAVDTGPGFDEGPAAPGHALPALVAYNQDALGVLMSQATQDRLALWRATAGRPALTSVRPRVERNATFATEKIRTYAAEGYRATLEALDR